METVFVQLYPFVFVIGMAGYGPQLYKLVRDRSSADGMSLSTWIIWAATWGISLGYGMTWLKDPMFSFVAGMNLIAHIGVIGIIVYRKWETAKDVAIMGVQVQPAYVRVRK